MVSFPYHQLTKIHLTERALADLNRLNDPDAPNPMPSTLTERKTTAYDRNFDQLLFDKGYKSCWMERLPKAGNWKEIQAMLSNDPIASSEDDYDTFVELLNDSRNETKLRTNVLPLFLRRLRIPNEQDMLFNNLEPLNEGLADAKPDLYDGARPSTLDPEIRACLSKMIVPSKETSAPILPNFFLEFKGPDGTPAVARRQILQDGSLGARAIKSLQEWRSVSDEGAHTISGTFHDGILDLYTTHCTMEEKNRPVYYTNIIFTRNMRQDPRSLGEGLAAIRNARVWARKQRDASIADANQRLATLSSSATSASSSSKSATLVSSAALGPLQKQALSRNNKPQSNSNKQGIATEDKENIGKCQKHQKN